MKLSKLKKIIISSVFATAGIAIAAGVAPTIANHASSQTTTTNNSSNNKITSITTASQSYSFSLQAAETTESGASTNPATAEYKIKIQKNTNVEGKVHLLDKDGKKVEELTFKPGDKITVEMELNTGYGNYTVRDLNVRGASENVYIPSKNVDGNKNKFEIQMPEYADTLDPLTNTSSIYSVGKEFSITPTFIKESIGVEDDKKVNWEHGAYADSLNGYVYDMSDNLTWSSLKDGLYKTFENKDITNPIDVYIYLHGHNLTLDTATVDLGIESGWAIHIYNNKTDSKESTVKDSKDGYGEIIVPADKQAKVSVKGSITLGSSVKFKFIPSTDGIIFISYTDTKWIGYQSNDPVQRLGQ